MDNRIIKVLEFYKLTARLKDVVREGWKQWHVSAPRVESVAEHVYSSCMLAIAVHSEFDYDLDIMRVVYMLAVHELEETIIGDITPFQNQDVKKQGRIAVKKILAPLKNGAEIEAVIAEFENGKTWEARFAKWVDKLDAGIQCKLYDMVGHIDVSDENIDIQRRCNLAGRAEAQGLAGTAFTLSDSWLEYCIESYGFDENFISLARGARKL